MRWRMRGIGLAAHPGFAAMGPNLASELRPGPLSTNPNTKTLAAPETPFNPTG